ncbi:hypothetical protein QOM21_14450 [Streptomyces sp. Pv4-95]|uniref:hypothetical protein n=1 Tax=Streptomyces sp. Pv4-95 TaxID=3049543 RepID=UPI0038913BFA
MYTTSHAARRREALARTVRAAAGTLAATARRHWRQAQRAAAMNVLAGTVKRGRA